MKLHVIVQGREFESRDFNPAPSNFDETRLTSCPHLQSSPSGGIKSNWARVTLDTDDHGRVTMLESQIGAHWYR